MKKLMKPMTQMMPPPAEWEGKWLMPCSCMCHPNLPFTVPWWWLKNSPRTMKKHTTLWSWPPFVKHTITRIQSNTRNGMWQFKRSYAIWQTVVFGARSNDPQCQPAGIALNANGYLRWNDMASSKHNLWLAGTVRYQVLIFQRIMPLLSTTSHGRFF